MSRWNQILPNFSQGIKLTVDISPPSILQMEKLRLGKLPKVIQLESGGGLNSALSDPAPALEGETAGRGIQGGDTRYEAPSITESWANGPGRLLPTLVSSPRSIMNEASSFPSILAGAPIWSQINLDLKLSSTFS